MFIKLTAWQSFPAMGTLQKNVKDGLKKTWGLGKRS
jgi:hypothetical protein